jgi:hypothetical protein
VEYRRLVDIIMHDLLNEVFADLRLPRTVENDIIREFELDQDLMGFIIKKSFDHRSRSLIDERRAIDCIASIIEEMLAPPEDRRTRGTRLNTSIHRQDDSSSGSTINAFEAKAKDRAAKAAQNQSSNTQDHGSVRQSALAKYPTDNGAYSKSLSIRLDQTPVQSELCTVMRSGVIESHAGVMTFANVLLDNPCNDAAHAFSTVKASLPMITATPKWCITISYPRVECARIQGSAMQARQVVEILREKMNVANSLSDLFMYVIATMNGASHKEFIEQRTLTMVNRYLRTYMRLPSNPIAFPTIKELSNLFEFTDKSSSSLREYMAVDGIESYIWQLIRSAFVASIGYKGDSQVLIDPSDENFGVLASINQLPIVCGKYMLRDYYIAPNEARKQIVRELNENWAVAVTRQTAVFSNVEAAKIITAAKNTEIPVNQATCPVHTVVDEMFKTHLDKQMLDAKIPLPLMNFGGVNERGKITWSAQISNMVNGSIVYTL